MSALAQPPARAGNLVTRRIAGETVIVPVVGGVTQLDCIFTLNESGTLIWQMLDGSTPMEDIAESFFQEYEVSREQAAREVSEFIASLLEEGLLQSPAPPA